MTVLVGEDYSSVISLGTPQRWGGSSSHQSQVSAISLLDKSRTWKVFKFGQWGNFPLVRVFSEI
jgi:hypothetical protein